jgi:cellulose synthase/poly-beta-1,6-N-acetylglucosamine synthase-like glycosyltransferase
MDTAIAAATQEYPAHCFKVVLLDDAKDDNLQSAVEAFNRERARSARPANICYLAREKTRGVPHHYKAGNLRHGLAATAHDAGEFFASFDADMIPSPDFLARTVPHLIKDHKIALLGCPQSFYNIPQNDLFDQEWSVLLRLVQAALDRANVAMCLGSGYVIRRSALDQIGRWPLVNAGEDVTCGWFLCHGGWKAAFIEDQLQCGLAGDSLDAHISQIKRLVICFQSSLTGPCEPLT